MKRYYAKKQVLALSLVLSLMFVASACSMKKGGEASPESADGVTPEADTALTEASSGVEMLPTSDTTLPVPPPVMQEPVASADPVPPPTEPAAAPSPAGTGEMGTYSVKKGDTLMRIAFNVYGDVMKWKSIHDLNKDSLRDPNALSAGMNLKYDKPASSPVIEKMGEAFKIRKGDTLGTIANDIYGKKSKWKALWENNKTLIKDPNKIYAGFYLYYQMTEQERQEAEALKGKVQLGDSQHEPVESKPSAPSVPVQGEAKETTGLQSLMNTSTGNRLPANAK